MVIPARPHGALATLKLRINKLGPNKEREVTQALSLLYTLDKMDQKKVMMVRI